MNMKYEQIIPEDIRRENILNTILNGVSMPSRAWTKSCLNSLYGIGAFGADFGGDYDNCILYTRMLGCDTDRIYQLSKRYRDTYDFASTGNKKSLKKLEIENVIFNDPATIVFWSDSTKTVVKCQPGDKFDPEKGLAMAIAKKMIGNTGSYCNVFKKWIKEEKSDGEV